jgi:NAD(P)-dependent dehydrogenase (short-subunit alcohol dehydrogenase family)
MAQRVALITGGGSGIGRAVALGFAREGYAVVITGRHKQRLDETAELGKTAKGKLLPVVADVRQPASVQELFAVVRRDFGRIDVLFNNAGVTGPSVPMEDLPYEEWKDVVETNLTGPFLCTQQAVRMMKAQQPRGGRIINNGSISAQAPRPDSAPYTATKHAITGLTKSTALDGRAFDIACGQIDIGNAATELTDAMASGVIQPYGAVAVEPRIDVEDVVRAVLYMASLPLDSNVLFMTLMATKMPLVGRG